MARKHLLEIIFTAVALVVLSLPITGFAQNVTSHDGTVSADSVVTLFGSGFGTRDADPESFFEDWDWGGDESGVDTLNGPWSTIGGDDDPGRFSNQSLRNGSGLNLRMILPDRITGSQMNDMVYRQDFEVHPGDKVYLSNFLWSTYGGAREFGNGCPQQWKIMNPLTHGPYVLGQPYTGLTWNAAGVDGPPDGDPYFWVSHHLDSGSAGSTSVNWGEQPAERTWWQWEVEYKVATTMGAEDGYVRVWFNGELVGEGPTATWNRELEDDKITADGYVYNTAVLRNYIQWSQCSARTDTVRHDDTCYQIGSWARVALGDANNWNACTVRDYQPIVEWNPTRIRVAVNTGAFTTGENAWLYVVDDDGNPSNAYGVEIGDTGSGGGGDQGAPGPPTPPELSAVID